MREQQKILVSRDSIANGNLTVNLSNNISGTTILELLVATVIASTIMVSVLQSLAVQTRHATEQQAIASTNEQARTLLDLLAYDSRLIGSGMPLGQTGFALDAVDLGNAPLPILLDSDSDNITFRLNENGIETVLTQSFRPAAGVLSFTVFSAADLEVQDTIYMSDFAQGGANGLRGVIAAINGNIITIQNNYECTIGAQFPSGSIVSRVSTIAYTSSNDWSGIRRDDGLGSVIVHPRSTFSIEYLDINGNTLALPLTPAVIKDLFSAIRITVWVRSRRPMNDGTIYTAQASQEVTLRNLVLGR